MVRRPPRSRRSLSARARALLGLGAAALMLVSASMPAAAAITMKGAVLKTKTITIAADSGGGGKVTCPTGYKVTAGGAFFAVGDPADRWLSASIPVSKGKAWYAAGYNVENVDSADLTIVAWCLPASRLTGAVTIQTVASIDSFRGSAIYVDCPLGYRIVTGGAIWQIPGDPPSPSVATTTFLSGTSPTLQGNGWWAGGGQQQPSAARMRVVAICAPKAAVGKLTTVAQNITELNRNSGIYLSCPDGQRVLSVGAYAHLPNQGPDLNQAKESALRSLTPTTDGKGAYMAAYHIRDEMAIVVQCRPLT